jgi:hypothetical protein
MPWQASLLHFTSHRGLEIPGCEVEPFYIQRRRALTEHAPDPLHVRIEGPQL